jgi:hypothetical protein
MTAYQGAGPIPAKHDMISEFDAILASKSKDDLDAYAELRGIKLDARRSFDNMLADYRAREAGAKAPEPKTVKMIEVQIVRKYAPHGFENPDGVYVNQPSEIKETVAPGTVMRMPSDEAQRALSAGIAVITANSFAS